MARLLVLTSAPRTEPVLPALELLPHRVHHQPGTPTQLLDAPPSDLTIVDGRTELAAARSLCQLIHTIGSAAPLMLVATEGGLSAVTSDWHLTDVILHTAGPAEVDARIRLALTREPTRHTPAPARVQASGITIDEQSYSAKIHGSPLDLTYKEFQLLHFLATHPSRAFTREQLLGEVWGDDYFGGTRTVDVHVRRLRAKLGEHEQVIGTVRNVGYRFNMYDEDAHRPQTTSHEQ